MSDWIPVAIVLGLFLVIAVAGLAAEERERKRHNPADPRCEFHAEGPRNMREVCHHPRCAARRAGFSH